MTPLLNSLTTTDAGLHGLLAEMNGGGPFLPVQASTMAPGVDYLLWFINAISVFFTLLILVLTVYFCWKYHYRKHPEPKRTGHNNALELTWTAIPTVIVFIMFFWGFFVFMDFTAPADDPTANANAVNVEGYTWGWRFKYRHPDTGVEVMIPGEGEPMGGYPPGLYLPVNVPTQFILKSDDVLHSFYIPAFRNKKDVVPGRYNRMSVEANVEGTYDIYCTEYCGDRHSRMLSKAYVVSQAKLNDVIRAFGDLTAGGTRSPEEVGRIFASQQGCYSCHANEGKAKGVGPAWTDIPAHMAAIAPGMSIEDYVRESIVNPAAKLAPGFGNQMNPYRFNDKEMGWLIAYIKSINGQSGGSPAPASGPASTGGTPERGETGPGAPNAPSTMPTTPPTGTHGTPPTSGGQPANTPAAGPAGR